ncbi:hypothetical protein AJ79_05487 [Helicocarpus griseus UAMH5409]|uniref:Ribosomal protein/NADH dehydrogenase domain-containing protein n=1 Tax=Helicocarpus griseus UAMH5409 TaxID=1447875 RepID=A0A2B7XNK2_9EURO|nr:hypothetical protein AJ79_05487 [Helicocarpus griseus UAMH5409]
MVSVVKRMRALQTLLNIRIGLGAAVLPTPTASARGLSPVSRIHLTYARKIYEGHGSARKFWRVCLPRLKYHNPELSMSVKQTGKQTDPAILSVYFNSKATTPQGKTLTTPGQLEGEELLKDEHAPKPREGETVRTINLRKKTLRHIWEQFKGLTGAEDIPITEADQAQIDEIQRQKERSDLDRKRVAENRQMIKDQEKLLEAAREDVKRMREEQ